MNRAMNIRFRAILASLAIAANSVAQASPAPTFIAIPLPGSTMSFDLPPDFVRVTDKNNGTNVLIEFVPRGQTVANWTRMVTIQAYRGLGASTEPSTSIARRAFYPAACRVGPIYLDSGERAVRKGLTLTVITNGCASLPAGAYPKALKGAGEQDFIMMFRNANTIYTLNYAERGQSFADKAPPRDPKQFEQTLRDIFGNVALTPGRVK